jgi:hypothetical protein
MKKTASVVLLMLLFPGAPAIAFRAQYTGEGARTDVAHALWAKQD